MQLGFSWTGWLDFGHVDGIWAFHRLEFACHLAASCGQSLDLGAKVLGYLLNAVAALPLNFQTCK